MKRAYDDPYQVLEVNSNGTVRIQKEYYSDLVNKRQVIPWFKQILMLGFSWRWASPDIEQHAMGQTKGSTYYEWFQHDDEQIKSTLAIDRSSDKYVI